MGLAVVRVVVTACIVGFALLAPGGVSVKAQNKGAEDAKPTASPQSKASCKIRKVPLLEGEAALAREDYPAALTLFAQIAESTPSASKAGTIQTLIEQNQVAEAEKQARAWVALAPKDAAATETLGEVLLRKGELPDAYKMASVAGAMDLCYARTYLLEARYESMSAFFATARKHIVLAHQLDPVDPDIRWAWTGTLPKQARLAAYGEILKEDRMMNARRKLQMASYLEHAKDSTKDDCSVTEKIETAKIPITMIQDGPIRVVGLALDVSFNGKRRRMEIDTGASGLVLSRGAAFGLGLVREQKTASEGVGDQGEVTTSTAHVESVKIGNLEFHHCQVEILEKRSALDIDGLIGGNVFSKYLLTLDYPGMQLRLDPLPKRPGEKEKTTTALDTGETAQPGPESDALEEERNAVHDRYIAPEMADWTKIYRQGHDLLLPVGMANKKLSMFSGNKLFLVDTGASLMMISPSAASEVTKVHGDDRMGISGISGKVKKVYSTDQFTFAFAGLKQTVDEMTSIDTSKFSHDNGVEVSGFLGIPVLSRLTVHIDYRDNLMKFDYDPKHDKAGSRR